jgi:type VI secretion system protein ImpL
MFGAGGVMDKFFTQYLAPHADTSGREWTWRQGSAVTSLLSPGTLREFQRAAAIRTAFFQTGGNQPMVSLAFRPPFVPGATVKFEAGGIVVESPKASSGGFFSQPTPPPPPSSITPITVMWPGASPRTAVSVAADRGSTSVLDKTGPWSLFRLLEAGSLSVRAETASATFIVGGQELRYQITSGSIQNPLDLRVLREFRCPTGI